MNHKIKIFLLLSFCTIFVANILFLPKTSSSSYAYTSKLAKTLFRETDSQQEASFVDLSSDSQALENSALKEELFRSILSYEDSIYVDSSFNFHYNDRALSGYTLLNNSHVIPENTRNSKEVMGFMTYWRLSRYRELQYDKLSTIAYFGLTCYENGEWVNDDSGYYGLYSPEFDEMVRLAHQNNVKVILVVKNFNNRSIGEIVANKDGGGDRLIENIVSVVRSKGLDGVNIDFEYIPDANYPVTDTLRSNFVNWHGTLADRIHNEFPGSHVSTDVMGSSGFGGTAYDLGSLSHTNIDYIMMMTYDYTSAGYWDGKRATGTAPLYGNNLYGNPNWNVSASVDKALQSAVSTKIIMGIPYYGLDFPVKSDQKLNYNAEITGSGGIETYGQIVDPASDPWHNDSTIKWNEEEKMTWYAYNYNGVDRQGYYDDARSLSYKYEFVKNRNLGGIGIWALTYDSGSNALWNQIRDSFQKVPMIIGFRSDVSTNRINSILTAESLQLETSLGHNIYVVIPTDALTSDKIAKMKDYGEVVDASYYESPVARIMQGL